MEKIEVLNLKLNKITFEEVLSHLSQLAKERKSAYACFTNVHMITEANKDDYLLNAVNSANYALPDGMPVAKAFQLIHGIKQERIAGMDFFPAMLKVCDKENFNVGLFGSTESVLEKINFRIKNEFPHINLTQVISPPFDGNWDNSGYIKQFNSTNTNVIFVALGCPKQEKWMYDNSSQINSVLLGVGGAFPVFAKELKRAPKWMSSNSLEWLYRLIIEPRRMWKRYFYSNSFFIKLLVKKFIENDV